jgi:dienelactone hydrolase
MSGSYRNFIYRVVVLAFFLILLFNLIILLSPSPYFYGYSRPGFDPYEFWVEDLSKNRVPVEYSVLENESLGYAGTLLVREKIGYPMYIDDYAVDIVGDLFYPLNYSEYDELHGVLLIHGIYGDRSSMIRFAKEFASRGFVALAIDAAGHGESGFAYKSKDMFLAPIDDENIKASLLYQVYLSAYVGIEVISTLGLDRFRIYDIGVVGVSMGGLTSFMVAALNEKVSYAVPIIAAGQLSSAIYSGGVANALIPPYMDIDRLKNNSIYLDPLYFARRIRVPILVIFGTHDEFFTIEGLINTVENLGTRNYYIKLNPNSGHTVTEEDISTMMAFIENIVFKEELPDKPELDMSYWGVISLADVDKPENYSAAVYWRIAAPGFPWIKIDGDPVFVPTFTPVEIVGEVKDPDGDLILSTNILYIDPRLSLAYIAVSITVIIGFSIKIWENVSTKWIVAKYTCLLLLMLSLVLPISIYPGRFFVNILQLIERFGASLQLLWNEALVIYALFILVTTSFMFENLQRVLYIGSSIVLIIFSIVNVYIQYVALGMAGFSVFLVPLLSIIPLIIGSIIIYKMYEYHI